MLNIKENIKKYFVEAAKKCFYQKELKSIDSYFIIPLIVIFYEISFCINPCLPISHGNLLPTAGCRFSYRDGNVRAE